MKKFIEIKGASEHNLKNFDVNIEHNKLTVVTGVSGSGKSSLVHDIICNEGQRRFLESYSTHARQYLKQIKRPDVNQIKGLPPAISVDQRTIVRNPRSTVGTMSEIYDYLRLLFARLGKPTADIRKKIERRLFSFNSSYGACPNCKGLGVEDKIDPDKLVEDDSKSLREGALVITTPSGYIVYSQVTMDVLNQVCNAHGFHVDIPWKDMTLEQKEIVLYGSDIIKIPFGKHTLESRMKWSGITAKPREEGYYKGIIPVMEEILKRDRNKNILRFVKTTECSKCKGKRLGEEALSVTFKDRNIADLTAFTVEELKEYFARSEFSEKEKEIGEAVKEEIIKRCKILEQLGLNYLTIDRESTTLSGGEAQRIRLANQLAVKLRGALFVLDEPSIGLHPKDNKKLLAVLDDLVQNGNTVLVVEHDEETVKHADNIIDIGPKAGINGGELLFSGTKEDFFSTKIKNSISNQYFKGEKTIEIPSERRKGNGKYLKVIGATHNNLKNIDIEFHLGKINVVTGVSGAGKSSLVHDILAKKIKQELNHTKNLQTGRHQTIEGIDHINKVIEIDQSPIGRTPRSNPATYTKLFDHIRDLYAQLPESKDRQFKKGRFSFNNKGGRCETCQGAGVQQIGMHFMGNVDVICEECRGKRFKDEILEIKYKGKSIYDVLEMSIDHACSFFSGQNRIMQFLSTLQALGLGYITLGQPATTLSGGEAQRIKLASELSRKAKGHTLYILDEPSTGLHQYDTEILLKSLHELADNGHTVIIIEHHTDIINSGDHIIDIGPGSGINGGRIIASGTPEEITNNESSVIGKELKRLSRKDKIISSRRKPFNADEPIQFKGITTNNLKAIDVSVPVNSFTVITGVSGSGKSSLAFDTIFSEGQKLYSESLSNYLRTLLKQNGKATFEASTGMTPAVGIDQQSRSVNPRSTLGTVTEIYDFYRLLFSRAGTHHSKQKFSASDFSFNNQHGACKTCKGLGYKIVCDPEKLVSDPKLSLLNGAMNGHKSGKFYGDPYGQYAAALSVAGKQNGIDFNKAWKELNAEEQHIAMYGTGDIEYDVVWKYKRKNREGRHEFKTKWQGFTTLVEEEFERKHLDKRGDQMMPIMKHQTCGTCKGSRIKPEHNTVLFAGVCISELAAKSVDHSLTFFKSLNEDMLKPDCYKISEDLRLEITKRLQILKDIGLGYLSIDRRSDSLSGGEVRRMRLAAQIISGLSGITYVLDEPTIGLHSRDTQKLVDLLFKLRDEGNTVIVVEHDADIIKQADHIIDMGPGAGSEGGMIIAEGSPEQIMSDNASLTGTYLKRSIQVPKPERTLQTGIQIKQAGANNLKDIDINIPSGGLIALTGVSGSGKSSLLFDVLYVSHLAKKPVHCKDISGFNRFDKIIKADQSLPGKSSSSILATWLGFFDTIRDMFADEPEAKKRGLKKTDFSFNTKGGRCESCKGQGRIKVSMDFLSDIEQVCEDCKGKRYQDHILNITHKGKTIYDILKMTTEDAKDFFDHPKLRPYFDILTKIGLNYLTIGQSLNTFSGGELQRIKLAVSLVNDRDSKNLYLLDEPTTGLHFKDVETLLILFHEMIETGHTIYVIEHNKDVIRHADHVIELGPEGGDKGGYLM